MSSRARIFATVTLLVSCLAGSSAWAQAQNLEAGKSPSQLFAGTCNACHKSPRGLLRTVTPGSLPGFLREHYTTSSDMASQLAAFLISNGAGDNRQAKQGADAKQGGAGDQNDRQGRKQRPGQEAGRPGAAEPVPAESGRQSRKRLGTDEMKPAPNAPAEAAVEGGPDGPKAGKQRLGKRSRPGEEVPVTEPKTEPGASDQAKGEAAKEEGSAGERPVPASEAKAGDAEPGEAKPSELPKDEKGVTRRDPVPPVTPAPAAGMAPPVASGPSEPAASAPKAPAMAAEPPAITASAPPPRPAGPPSPPISQ